MTNITQKIRSITTRMIIIASLAPIGLLAISSAQAAKPSSSAFCPCFSSTVIDATIAELRGFGLRGVLDGTDGGFTCYDDGDEIFLSFNNGDRSVDIRVFGDTGPRPGCGWSGRPLDTTTQEGRACQDEVTDSWAWKLFDCPSAP